MTDRLIELIGIRFGYTHEVPLFDGLSLELRPEERLVLTGSNGAGKTTLLHLMVGLVMPWQGEVRIFGEPRWVEADFRAVRRKVGLLFQDSDAQLFCPTVFDDVAFGPLNLGKSLDETRGIVRQVLEDLDLAGLEERITYQLSYGQKRLVALASVLAMAPRVLLLDEPTSGLDAAHEERLIEILLGRREEMIIATHDQFFIERVATRLARIENGKIVEGVISG